MAKRLTTKARNVLIGLVTLALLFVVFFLTSCASFRQTIAGMTDDEFQAKLAAQHVIEEAIGHAPYAKYCPIDYTKEPLEIRYESFEQVQADCGGTPRAPVGGCNNGPRIIIAQNPGFSINGVLRWRYKILVHEFIHFYIDANQLNGYCRGEIAAHYGTESALDGIRFYRPSL